MEQKRYVQHISGKGERWKVHTEFQNYWVVYSHMEIPPHFTLPKSDFLPCEPPEEWEDVTDHCEIGRFGQDHLLPEYLFCVDRSTGDNVFLYNKYRVRKIDHLHNGPAFIIERKKIGASTALGGLTARKGSG